MNKKGISPLIASILLIGFTIAIAALVTYWYMGNVKEQIEKRGAVDAIRSSCTIDVDFRVDNICISGSGDIAVLEITAKNNKDKMINGIKLSLIDSNNNNDVITSNEYFNGLEDKLFKIESNRLHKIDITKLTKAKIAPILVREGFSGTCTDKIVEMNVVPCSNV